uniref:Secreted protein n=1 Tax=Cacopsylla melanoneura TaxID=428564 RepID=A0A8D9BA14_9HEMI
MLDVIIKVHLYILFHSVRCMGVGCYNKNPPSVSRCYLFIVENGLASVTDCSHLMRFLIIEYHFYFVLKKKDVLCRYQYSRSIMFIAQASNQFSFPFLPRFPSETSMSDCLLCWFEKHQNASKL